MFIQNLIVFLAILSMVFSLVLAKFSKFFSFMFVLVYVGAILVLIVYTYSSQKFFKNFSFSVIFVFLGLFLFFLLYFNLFFDKNLMSSEFKDFFYKKKEMYLVLFLCIFILLVLFCMLNLDYFRFSSLRAKF